MKTGVAKRGKKTGRADWANFRPLDDCFLWAVFFTEEAQILGLIVSEGKNMY
jgi:hypothetical protein